MRYVITVVFVLGVIWIGCKDTQPLEGKTSYSELKFDTLYAQKDTFLVQGRVSTAGSPNLLLGSYAGFTAKTLLHFKILPDDTIQPDSVFLILHSRANFGTAADPINGKIQLIKKEWVESINENDTLDLQAIDADPYFINTDSADFRINLPLALLDSWRDTTGGNNNFGLALDYENAGFIKEFYSGNTENAPELIWSYHSSPDNSVVYDTTTSTLDASLIDFNGDLKSDALYVGAGYLIRSFIKFDFKSLPENINVAYVNFYFPAYQEYSYVNSNKSQNFYLRNVQTPFEELSAEIEIEIDETPSENLFVLSDENKSFLKRDDAQLKKSDGGRYYIQDILNNDIKYDSFMIMYSDEGYDASIYSLKRSGVKNEAPRIIIGYNTIIPPRL